VTLTSLVALGGVVGTGPTATLADGDRMKAVIIVGPASGSTSEYRRLGERLARQSAAAGMVVRKVFTPHASWSGVLADIQGANLVVYLGHGNGWPSPHGPFQEDTKDGFGLNPCDGDCGTSGPTRYFGGDRIREKVRLAPNAVVLLYRLCYAAGNGEQDQGPTFDRALATERVDNFAAAFLKVGAAAVFAYGGTQAIDFPHALAATDKTMDEIFMTSTEHARSYYDGFVGWGDYYRESRRMPGTRIHLDPHPERGHYRAVTGRLTMTAREWRGLPPRPDAIPPELAIRGTQADGDLLPTGATAITFSPNGDHIGDLLVVRRRLSEYASVTVEVRDGSDRVVRRTSRWSARGEGRTTWDGRNSHGMRVRDGLYTVRLTPRDAAGNVGGTRTVAVRVLTTLAAPRRAPTSIHVRDHDRSAKASNLSVRLTHAAVVTWRILNSEGVPVRTRLDGVRRAARVLRWSWAGRNRSGHVVKDGWYRSVVSAATPAGTMRYARRIYVGAFRFQLKDGTPVRGQRVKVFVRSTERLTRPPRIVVDQPGVKPFVVRSRHTGDRRFVAVIRFRDAGKAGPLRITVRGKDRAGGRQASTRLIRIL
jgi:flagellar hook assembly protein FlgD